MDLSKVVEVIGLVVGSGALSSIITSWFNRRKSGAETDSVIVGNIMSWAIELNKRIEKLEADIVVKDALILELQIKVTKLERNGSGSI